MRTRLLACAWVACVACLLAAVPTCGSLGAFARTPLGLRRADDNHDTREHTRRIDRRAHEPRVPYEPVHDEIVVAVRNRTSRTYLNPATGLTLNSDGSQSSPITGEVVLPRPAPGLEPTIVLPNARAVVVTVDATTGNLVSCADGVCGFVDVESRRVVDAFGDLVRRLAPSARITIVTNNGTLVDVDATQQQLHPETLEVVTNSTDAVESILTPRSMHPLPIEDRKHANEDDEVHADPFIIVVAYNASIDAYVDVASDDVVNSDGSESDLRGVETLLASPQTVIIPSSPHSLVCTQDAAGNLVASTGEYVALASRVLISRDAEEQPIATEVIVVVATNQGTVVDAQRRRAQLDPESLIPVTSDMSRVVYTPTPSHLNTIDQDAPEDDALSVALAKHGITRRSTPKQLAARREAINVREHRIRKLGLRSKYRSHAETTNDQAPRKHGHSSSSASAPSSSAASSMPALTASSSLDTQPPSGHHMTWYVALTVIVCAALTIAAIVYAVREAKRKYDDYELLG